MTDPDVKITVHRVPMLDTGIGQEAGYANDQEFIEAVDAERAALDPEVREALEQAERDLARKLLGL